MGRYALHRGIDKMDRDDVEELASAVRKRIEGPYEVQTANLGSTSHADTIMVRGEAKTANGQAKAFIINSVLDNFASLEVDHTHDGTMAVAFRIRSND